MTVCKPMKPALTLKHAWASGQRSLFLLLSGPIPVTVRFLFYPCQRSTAFIELAFLFELLSFGHVIRGLGLSKSSTESSFISILAQPGPGLRTWSLKSRISQEVPFTHLLPLPLSLRPWSGLAFLGISILPLKGCVILGK